jgi:hypothetical protein
MNERIEKELKALANKLGKTDEELTVKYNEIANTNGLDLENDRQAMVALTLTRNFVRGSLKGASSGGSFGDNAFGFIVGTEPARDVQEWRRKNLLSDYRTNANTVFNEERCAEVVLTDAGAYEKSQVRNGEVETKNIPHLPNSAIEIDENKWIVPLDNVKAFMSGDTNPRYGKPQPAEEWRMRAHLIAKVDGDFQYWTLGLKNEAAKEFDVNNFEWLHLHALFNDERNACYGIKGRTLNSLRYNEALDPESDNYVDTSSLSMEDLLGECMPDYIADLIEIEDYHTTQAQNPGMKLVITDGIVSSMNLKENAKTGNRVIWIEPADANYGFEEDDVPESTPCWVPSNVNINFGVGSDVIIIGRSNQSQKKDDDGNYIEDEWNSVSLNIFGILPRVALGAPNEEQGDNTNDVDFW